MSMLLETNMARLIILLLLCSRICQSSHIEGGSVSWKVTQDNEDGTYKVQTVIRSHSRRSGNTCRSLLDFKCVVRNGGCYNAEDLRSPFNTCPNTITNDGKISDTSQSVVYTNEHKNEYITRMQESCCWKNALYDNIIDYKMSYHMDLSLRSDTGLPNSAPALIYQPFANVRIGCPEAIKIHTLDQDVGDIVTCRFGNAEIENGDIERYPYFSINEEECELVYNGGGSTGDIAVSIIAEDR
uniref:Uncharacterized protein n=1 Tax=Ciona intestinalis TaxID=7719 RepID=H2Y0B4_CIOIN